MTYYREKLDPYETLGITKTSTNGQVKSAYFKKLSKPSRTDRTEACLAYDMIVRKQRYKIEGNYYTIKNKDIFYYLVVGDLDKIKNMIDRNKNLIKEKDELGRNLLYLAARNGYYDVTKYLIEKGINVNSTQHNGSTPLHGAAFYGQQLIVQLLIDHGALTDIKNEFGHLASDEAKSDLIRENILTCNEDKILNLYQKLSSKKLATNLVFIEKKNKENKTIEVVAKKIMCNSSELKKNENYVCAWHGTRYEYLESIVENGLVPAGSKLSNGKMIKPPEGHISLDKTIDGIKEWAKAIFVSPSLFYASHVAYAKRISSRGKTWATLVQVKVKPGSYTTHAATTFKRRKIEGEPVDIEYRIEANENDELIYRTTSKNNVIIHSITFVSVDFLDNIRDYTDEKIVVNSKEERELLSFD